LPYFVLSATSPLVQAWFGSRCPGQSPYRLYALSNFGSLAALLSYPLLFEPTFDLWRQSAFWSGAFLVYAALCAVSLACMWKLRDRQWAADPAGAEGSFGASGSHGAPNWGDRAAWLLLPACASLMLLAATNHVCQDVAVVPLLWVIPLALYLLSFIICFDHARWYVRPVWAGAAVAALLGATANDLLHSQTPLSLVQELLLYFAMLFFVCMVCHGELVRRKPNPRYLTEFYLLIAAGGALGGLLVAVVAPLVFSSYLEWPVGMAISGVLALGLLLKPVRLQGPKHLACLGAVLIVAGGLYGLASWKWSLWPFATDRTIERARNFFGVIGVQEYFRDDPAQHQFLLVHGRITHGYQFADPTKRKWATSYYGEKSGVGQAIQYFQKLGKLRLGAIGLGTGTLACYARPNDVVRFYEINPEVLRLARERFHYLGDCRGKWDVVMGDARLSLEAEPSQRFEVLVLDAFTGDAIPAHLLTREAFDVYLRHLVDGGVIAVHVSNKYLHLVPVVRRLAEHCGLGTTRISAEGDEERLLSSNEWVLVTRNKAFLRAHPPAPPFSGDDDQPVRLWTDQYSNLVQILSGGLGGFWR
jgi:hypothetical protein